MDFLTKIKTWARGLTEVGVSLLALGIVLEILFMGQPIPFWPNINIIGNVQSIVAGFSGQGKDTVGPGDYDVANSVNVVNKNVTGVV